MSNDNVTIDTIREYQRDIEATKASIKQLTEQLADILSEQREYDDMQEAKAAYSEALAALKVALLNNGTYNNTAEALADERQKLKDQQDILSLHVVEYYADTRERQIELNPINGDAREVIVTGKLGKKQKYQTNLFGSRVSIDVVVD